MTRPLPAIIDPIEEAMGQAKPSGSSVRPFVFLLHRRGGLHFFIGRCPGSPIKGTEISGLALTRHGYFKPFSISISKKLRLSTWRQWQSGGSHVLAWSHTWNRMKLIQSYIWFTHFPIKWNIHMAVKIYVSCRTSFTWRDQLFKHPETWNKP